MKRTMTDIRAKSKKKKAVNPNKLFIALHDIRVSQNSPVIDRTPTVDVSINDTVLLDQPAGSSDALDTFYAVAKRLQSIHYEFSDIKWE